MVKKGYKYYGLKGKTIRIRKAEPNKEEYSTSSGCIDPWAYTEQKAKVTYESPYFLVMTILPHHNPHGTGESLPYQIGVNKHEILCGDMIIHTMDGERIMERRTASAEEENEP